MLNKAKNIFLAFIAISVILVGCEEETTEEPVLPAAPTNLQATSVDESTVNIRFDISADHSAEGFVGYELDVIDEAGNSVLSNSQISNYTTGGVITVQNLSEGKIYDFKVTAVNADGESEAISVKWSPAYRLNNTINNVEIRVYGSASQFGSGLKVYSEDEFGDKGPEILTVASKAMWNLAFDDTNDMFRFGSADQVSIGANSDNPTNPAELSSKLYDAAALNDVFDSEALSQATFTPNLVNLGAATYNDFNGIVLVFRIMNDDNTYNYGKILIKKDATDGNFVFNEGTSDQYLDCVISYQRTADVPYAKIGF